MPDVVTDTHSLVWYLENDPRLGPLARKAFEACDRGEITVYVPTICLVEITYLQEKGRIPAEVKGRFDSILEAGTSGLVPPDLSLAVVLALGRVPRSEIPDMPDRIIDATALHLDLPLVSRDSKIQASTITTIW